MTIIIECVHEALLAVWQGRRRLLPMALGIIWGMASVMALLAVAAGFENGQRRALAAYGDRFVMLRLNRAEIDRAAGGVDRQLRMDALDIERLRIGAPAIRRLSPMNMAYRARITAHSGAGSQVVIAGALPEVSELRHLPLSEGRFFNELDDADRRRVIVLGPQARRQLFGVGPAIGQTVRVTGFSTSSVPARVTRDSALSAGQRGAGSVSTAAPAAAASPAASPAPAAARVPTASSASSSASSSTPSATVTPSTMSGILDVRITGEIFEVIGVLADVEVQRESYVSIARLAFVPFGTSLVVFNDRFNTIFIEPRTTDDRDLALEQFRQVMGARYGFTAEDENAVLIYFDAIGRARSIEAVFGGLRLFLSIVGALILAIGAIGVMNVVLVSVAARRFEIGLRKAVGATPGVISLQFFLETAIGCVASGALGFLLGGACIALLRVVPLPEGIEQPSLDLRTALTAFGLLSVLAVAVGIFPARQAARMTPIEALRGK